MARIPGTIMAGTSQTNAAGEQEWSLTASGTTAPGGSPSGQSAMLVQGQVVSGNQGYTVGTTQILNMEPGGRLKVSVSYAANVAPAARAASNDGAALVAAIYNATRPTWADGNTGALQVSARGALIVLQDTLSPTAGTNLGGTVGTSSAQLFAADPTRRPGDIQGQNTGSSPFAFNEFGGAAVIGGTATAPTGNANSFVVPVGATFSISTTNQVNAVSLAGTTVAVTRL